jgi:hypothetical protein
MLTVEMLPARYGDALLVTWGLESKPHRMLIHGGLASVYQLWPSDSALCLG